MKDYSDYLICSDFDGTLSVGEINEKNIVAIKNFMECGGKFTLCTGRKCEDIVRHSVLPFELNAPMIGLTGAQIYDTRENRVVEANCLDNNWIELVNKLVKEIKYNQTFEIVGATDVYRFYTSDKAEQKRVVKKAMSDTIYKIVGWTDYHGDSAVVPGVKDICCNRYNVTSNGPATYEVTALGIDKGYGVRRVKELVGAKMLICVGDYVGDISMLKEADISYAVDNAVDELKAVADRVTVHARDGAIAKIIEELCI